MVLMAASIVPGVAGGEEETTAADPASWPDKQKGYFRRHLLHWVTAFGTSYADGLYEDQVGYSKDPLIFSDPPGIDRWVRHGLSQDRPTQNYVLENRSTVGMALTLGAVVLSNLGREHAGRWIADDTTGFVEIWFFDKGASGLVKNIIGRQRPPLEFIDEDDDLSPEERQEEEDKRTNHQSFYSGAASHQFAMMSYADALVAGRVKSRPARIASFLGFYGYAAYIGYSRIEADKHYFTDVVAGAAAGILIGRGFYSIHHRSERHDRRVTLRSVAPIPGGVSVLWSVRL
jgi:hypothetical protein